MGSAILMGPVLAMGKELCWGWLLLQGPWPGNCFCQWMLCLRNSFEISLSPCSGMRKWLLVLVQSWRNLPGASWAEEVPETRTPSPRHQSRFVFSAGVVGGARQPRAGHRDELLCAICTFLVQGSPRDRSPGCCSQFCPLVPLSCDQGAASSKCLPEARPGQVSLVQGQAVPPAPARALQHLPYC